MQTTINYQKYENMNTRQLINSLMSAEKKEEKLIADFEIKVLQTKELIKYLKAKIKSNLNKPKNYTLDKAPSFKQIKQWEAEHPQETAQARTELMQELQGYENDHNSIQQSR